jgi:hypothetical protein
VEKCTVTVTSGFPDDFSRYPLLKEPYKNGIKVVPGIIQISLDTMNRHWKAIELKTYVLTM